MLISRPKLFAETSSREKWINALSEKIRKTQRELEITKSSESDKIKKIARLESKLESLQGVKENLEKSTQTEIFTADKETQTDLTSKQIEEMEKVMEQLRKIEIPKK
jgi:transglutaminase/protease-like cytokinesis protein 3